jgi:hypothetical protein
MLFLGTGYMDTNQFAGMPAGFGRDYTRNPTIQRRPTLPQNEVLNNVNLISQQRIPDP